MQHYFDKVQDISGNALRGATVSVYNSLGVLATLYSGNGVTPISNPITTDLTGQYSFYAANGTYSITVSAPNFTTLTIPGLVFYDPLDVSYVTVSAIGDGVTDVTALIQSTINANPGKTIRFNAGAYVISAPLLFGANNTRLEASGYNATYIVNKGTNSDAVQFTCPSNLATSFLSGCGIEGIYIYRPPTNTATSGAAIRLTQCSNFLLENVIVLDCPQGIQVYGGQENIISNTIIFGSSNMPDISGTANTNLLGFHEAACAGGTFQPCYVDKLTNVTVSPGRRTDVSVFVGNCDGAPQMSQCYINGGKNALMRLLNERDSTAAYIGPLDVSNTYFDGGNQATGAVVAIDIPADGFTNSAVYNVNFVNNFFGNTQSHAVRVRKTVTNLGFTANDFANLGGGMIDYQGSTTAGSVMLNGNKVSNLGISAAGTDAIKIQDAAQVEINANKINDDTGGGFTIKLLGTIPRKTITSNIFKGGTADFSNATGAAGLVYGSNNSDRSSTSTSLMGLKTGNFAQDDTAALDWYEEGTFTPTLTFGGAAVGLTYTTQLGEFTRIGNRVFFSFQMVLNAKGSSTGAAVFAGLPYTVNGLASQAATAFTNGMTSGVGDSMMEAVAVNTTATAVVYKIAAGNRVQLADTDFVAATSDIRISGHYRV